VQKGIFIKWHLNNLISLYQQPTADIRGRSSRYMATFQPLCPIWVWIHTSLVSLNALNWRVELGGKKEALMYTGDNERKRTLTASHVSASAHHIFLLVPELDHGKDFASRVTFQLFGTNKSGRLVKNCVDTLVESTI